MFFRVFNTSYSSPSADAEPLVTCSTDGKTIPLPGEIAAFLIDSKLRWGKELISILFIQGDSKRLLKVHESISLIFFGPGDLKFCTE